MKKFFLLLVVLCQAVFAQSFDFNLSGEERANNILKNYVEKEYNIEDADCIAYFWEDSVLGIIKHNTLYTLEGYQLIVLKQENNEYKPIKCDIFFDNTKEVSIEKNKVIFYKSAFYKGKKYSAVIKNNEIKTNKTLNDKLTDRKVRHIDHITTHKSFDNDNVVELSDFKTNTERKVKIKYNNLNEKTKHYLYMQ